MGQRVEFLKRLPQALHMFDPKTAQKRVLPALLLQMRDENVTLFVLPSVLSIAKQLSDRDFVAEVLPQLGREMDDSRPVQVLLS